MSSTYADFNAGRYGAGAFPTYGSYDTNLPSTAGSSSSVLNGYNQGPGYGGSMSSFSNQVANPLDEQQIYERLADQSYKSRSEVLEHLRTVLRRSSTALPYANPELIFDGLALALTDPTWDVRQLAIQVIRDALPKLGERLIPCANIVMPLLVNNIGDRKTTVRKGVTQALHCYLKQPRADASLCLSVLVLHGFNSTDSEVVRETVAIVPVLLTQEFAEMIDISRLMGELMRKLPAEGQPIKDRIEQLALAALEKVRSVVGEGRFAEAQNRCPRSLRRRYSVLQADKMDDVDSDHEPDVVSSRIAAPVAAAAPTQNAGRNSYSVTANNESSYSSPSGPVIAPTYASVTASTSVAPNVDSQESKYFGIIPGDVYSKLMDENPRARLQGADELKAIITRLQSGIVLHSSLSDLLRFLSDFLDDANFKVVTTTLEIYLLLIKTAVDIRPHVGTVVDAVGRRMSDAKLLIRQGVSSVMLQLMRLVTAMPVLELISAYYRHKNSRMRQESTNVTIAALLSFPKEDFEFDFIANAIVQLLLDSKFQVRQAAMECVSVIAHLLGPSDLGVLMRAIHKVEDTNPVDAEGLANAVKVRAARHQLPRLNSDGLVEYSVALPGSASQRAVRPMPQGSDTSLILAAAGGHSAARPSQSVSVFQPGGENEFLGPRTPLSGKARLPWQSQPAEQAVPFSKRANNGFFDADGVEELVTTAEPKADRRRNKNNDTSALSYFKHYLETGNKRQLAFENGNRLHNQMPPHMSSSTDVLTATRSESPNVDVWNYDDTEHSRPRPSKNRNNQPATRPSHLVVSDNEFRSDKDHRGSRDIPQPQLSKKGPTQAPHAAVAPKQLATSVAYELSNKAALDQPNGGVQQMTPPDQVKHRGSATQRRAQRIFDRLESEDAGINRSGGNKLSGSKGQLADTEDFSPKMPHRKVPALEKAFFIDFGEDKPLKPPPKLKTKPTKTGGSPPRQIDNELYDEVPRRNQKHFHSQGIPGMDVDADDAAVEANFLPLPVRATKHDRKSLPDKNLQNANYHHPNQHSQNVHAAADHQNQNFHGSPPLQSKKLVGDGHHNSNGNQFTGYFANHVMQLQSSGRSNIPVSQNQNADALMEEDTFHQKPRKQPPPIKQPAISLGALNNRGRGGFDGTELTDSFNNNNNSSNEEQFFTKTLPRSKKHRGQFGLDDSMPPEQAFPGNATYSYIAALEGNTSSSGIGSSSPSNRNDSVMRSGIGFPSRDDLSRQSTHSLVAEERLRSGDERMIEKYEELKRRQKAFLRALSANFASDVTAAEQHSLSSTMSTGSLSAYDHNRSAAPSYGVNDGSGSAPPKISNRRPLKLKPVAPPAGYQASSRTTPRKGGVAFTTFTVNAQLRAADLAYDLLPEPQPNGVKALASAATAFSNDDWEVKCEAVNIVRSVVKHDPGALTHSPHGNQLHTVNLSIIAEMRNLRSQVARLAIQGMREMFTTLKRSMDIDAENITKVLLGRSGDTNQFLRADAEQALTAMVLNVGPGKALTALLQCGLGHRNVSIRRSTCQHLLEVVERMGPSKALTGVPEITGQLLPALLQFLMDGSPETRFYARKICHLLISHPDFDRMMQKFCSPNVIANARDAVETVRNKGPGELTSIGSSQRLSDYGRDTHLSGVSSASSGVGGSALSGASFSPASTPQKPRHVAPLRRLDEATLDHVRTIIAQMASNDWRQRYEGISSLAQLAETSPEVTTSQLTKLFDKFCPLLKDMNSKVNLYALQAFQGILPVISNQVGQLMPLIMQHLTINLSSKSHEIQQAAAGVVHTMLAYVDPACLLQPFANQTQTANSRNKAFMIDRLSEVVDSVCGRKMKQVTLHILPLLWHLLGSVTQSGSMPGGAGNIRLSTARLANVLYQHMGDDLLQHAGAASLPEKNYLLLQDLIRTSRETHSGGLHMRQGPSIGEDLDQVVAAG